MALFRSERGIGRGEVAESRLEVPFLIAFMMLCALLILWCHLYWNNPNVTAAVAVSAIVVGVTLVRIDLGAHILVLAMMLSPEISTGGVGTGARSLNLRYNDFLIFILFLGVLVQAALSGRFRMPQSPLNAGIFAYYAVCLISTGHAYHLNVRAWNKVDAMFQLLKILQFYIVFFFVLLSIRDVKSAHRQLFFLLFVAVIVCCFGIFSIHHLDRVSAPFEKGGTEPNTLGGYLTIIMLLAVGLFLHAPNRRLALMFFGLGILALIPFLYTLSRASYLALIAGLFLMGVLGKKPLLIAAVVVVLLMSPLIMPEDVKDRVNYTFQRGSGKEIVITGKDTGLQVDKSTYERIQIWRKVRFNLKIWPLFGGGVSWESVLDSHFALVIIETGLVGLMAYCFLIYLLFRTCREGYLWSSDWISRGFCLGMSAVVPALVVHSLGTITFLIVRIMEPFWFLMALVVIIRRDAIEAYWAKRRVAQEEQYRQAQLLEAEA